MKLLKRILLLLMIGILLFSSYVILKGRREYQKVINEKPIEQVVRAYTDKEDYVSYEEIDIDYVNAVVAVEDQRYFSRKGFDWIALIRAMFNNMLARKNIEGGSTISQQIAKNLYYVGKPRGVTEKIAEVFIMLDLEKQYSKEDLVALYANINYYGDGYWGIRQASNGYFGKEPIDLSIAQAALLAGIPNAPSAYQLSTGYDLAISRQHKVLRRMLEEDYITQYEYQMAIQEDIKKP